jgi:predicted  nucleic acid-binding Zn-ribbon protein
MLPDVSRAVQLQDLDTQANRLRKEIATLPKHVAEIERKLESHQRKLDNDHAAVAANQKERKKLDGDIQVFQQKISKLRDQMLLAKTNEQYRAFQNEIEYGEAEIRKLEDRIIELMTLSEPLEKNVRAAEGALKAEKAEVEKEKLEAHRRTDEDKAALAILDEKRKKAVAEMTPRIYQRYEVLRKNRGGIAVAEVVDGRCTACRIILRLQYVQDLKADKDIFACESCGRILYHNPPVAVEDLESEGASRTA